MLNTTLPQPLIVDPAGQPQLMQVLMLDDMEVDRKRLRRLCRKAGLEFDLHEAEDLAGFRAALDRQSYDLVFLDYYLAMDTGLDALRILRAHADQANAIPIMITSVERYDVAVEAMREGCADYITKEQLSVEALRKSIASAIERRILITALNEAHGNLAETNAAHGALQASLARMAKTCGPEIRATLIAALRHVRSLRSSNMLNEHMRRNLSDLEKYCHDIFAFIDDVKLVLEDTKAQMAKHDDRRTLPAGPEA